MGQTLLLARLLVVYDRQRRTIVRETEFSDGESKRAVNERLAVKIAPEPTRTSRSCYWKPISRETLLIAHASYFKTVAEIARAF